MPANLHAESPRQRSETGRHQPQPHTPREVVVANDLPGNVPKWFAGFGGGMIGGGDLWRLATLDGIVAPWIASSPFASARFSTTLDYGVDAIVYAGRRVSGLWSVRVETGRAAMDIVAEARQGQTGGVFLYDQLIVTSTALVIEANLVHRASYPYFSGGIVASHITARREQALNQNAVGFQMELGYSQQVTTALSVRLGARYSHSGFTTGDFVPQTTANWGQPETVLESAGGIGLFGVNLAIQFTPSR